MGKSRSTVPRSSSADAAVGGFLRSLPPERAAQLTKVRDVVLKHLPAGYEEVVLKGMIVFQVPAARYSSTYNGRPLWLAALAAPKSYLTLHLLPIYGSPELLKRLEDGFRAARKPLRMGKGCINFERADDLALDTIGEIVAAMPVDRWVAIAERARRRRGPGERPR